jgi:organic hydroperoxide reductase OsmC/OhrA
MSGHHYTVSVSWSGNRGSGTSGYKDYGREHIVSAKGKADIHGSADKTFFGNVERWNPEELLIAALSQCHMLSFLHVAADAGVVVTSYRDNAQGTLTLERNGGGRVTDVVLRPRVVIDGQVPTNITELHHRARELCFIANSVNFPVRHEPETLSLDSL